jgi:hypothetical protein
MEDVAWDVRRGLVERRRGGGSGGVPTGLFAEERRGGGSGGGVSGGGVMRTDCVVGGVAAEMEPPLPGASKLSGLAVA